MSDAVVRAMGALIPGGVTRGELDRSGRVLRWIEAGAGSPTVVLDAASGTSGLTWAPILPALARHTRVVAYDRAGLGLSDPVRLLAGVSAVEDLTALLSHAAHGPCVLVGHSWGGLLAQQVAWSTPELLSGLVLVDPAHEEFRPALVRVAETALLRLSVARRTLGLGGRLLREDAVKAAEAVTDDPRTRGLLIEAELAAHGRTHQIRTALAESLMIEAHVPAVRRMRASSRLPAVPVTVLSATRGLPKGMRTRWTALQARVVAGVDQGKHEEVRGAGHYIHQSRPETVAKAVLDVVERVRLG